MSWNNQQGAPPHLILMDHHRFQSWNPFYCLFFLSSYLSGASSIASFLLEHLLVLQAKLILYNMPRGLPSNHTLQLQCFPRFWTTEEPAKRGKWIPWTHLMKVQNICWAHRYRQAVWIVYSIPKLLLLRPLLHHLRLPLKKVVPWVTVNLWSHLQEDWEKMLRTWKHSRVWIHKASL